MLRTIATFSAVCRQSLRKTVDQTRTVTSPTAFQRTMCSSSVDQKIPTEETELHVEHDTKQQKFFIRLEEGDEAVLEYEMNSKGEASLLHTGVPDVYRGRGIAKLLAVAAFDHFASRCTPMHLVCTYLQRHAQLFPQHEHQKFILPD